MFVAVVVFAVAAYIIISDICNDILVYMGYDRRTQLKSKKETKNETTTNYDDKQRRTYKQTNIRTHELIHSHE